MMCSKDNYYQEFVIEGEEYKQYKYKWLGRISQYYGKRTNDEHKNGQVEQTSQSSEQN
jgi:hypothetical protein